MGAALRDNIQLIACDLDGTLLHNFTEIIEPRAFALIDELCDKGIYFFAASGRQYASLKILFKPVAERIGYICENGGLAVLNDKTIYCETMDKSLWYDVCKYAETIPNCAYTASGTRTLYISARQPKLIDHVRKVKHFDVTPVESVDEIPDEIIKVAFHVAPCDNEPVRQLFAKRFEDSPCRIVTSGTEWVDVVTDGVNKGSGIRAVAKALNLSLDNCAAFGDAENDREILEAVGHPYLMDPCTESMLDIAKLPQTKRCDWVEDTLEELLGKR